MANSQFHLQDWRPRSTLSLLALLAAPLLLTWLFTTIQAKIALTVAQRAEPGKKRAPTLPWTIPFLGHAPSFMRDGHGFLTKALRHFGAGVPCGINMAAFSTYFVSGPELVAAFLKDPGRGLSQTSRSLHIMEHAFGCPREHVDRFQPQGDLDLEHEIHSAVQGMLSGPRLDTLADRFQEALIDGVSSGDAKMDTKWADHPDLSSFVERVAFEAALHAVVGPHLVAQCPTVAEDFWQFNKQVKNLFMGIPHWLNPEGLRARNKIVGHVKCWLRYAHAHCNPDEVPESVEWEPYFGSKSTRIRQQLLAKRNITDETARAAENLAFIWATNANSLPAASWVLLEVLGDAALQRRVRSRLSKAIVARDPKVPEQLPLDIDILTEDALLQSIYAETLRLRVAVLIIRQPNRDNFSLCGWHFEKKDVVGLANRNELMDQEFWNAGTAANPRPLDKFWSDRFLVYHDDPTSGPLKHPRRQKKEPAEDPYFSIEGCSWKWIPYGGGRSLCPGRQFAKREIALTVSIILQSFDIELFSSKLPVADESVYGFGTMPPNAKIPCRIRRRTDAPWSVQSQYQ